ncbi:type 1 fimbrial protein [Citrobacter sp. RHB20-C16]|nr:type 1 fimbrial protein [Citrobacter sp. CFNIH10]MBJ9072790.1 type 1 fimbrial protein [Citrobacter amalonaticus]QMK78807.1 type 1 fimbrial protein [Citrobacter sp. RHB20-C16]QMK83422.1 type 1 fimbrial protein [Citrobacter sp. RHB20-C15]QPB30498.1 type 1 fimbrial protein [Citrobacter amalonaticus]
MGNKTVKRNIFVCLILALSTSTAVAAPEDNAGTIHFTGEIITPSCVIVGDSGTTYNVPLGTYPTSYFTSVGVETDLVPVIISLSSCPMASDGLSNVQLTFNGTTVASTTDKLAVSGAGGIGIVLSEEGHTDTLIKLDKSDGQVFIPLPAVASDTISTTLQARYKSVSSTITAGAADADLTINILYR